MFAIKATRIVKVLNNCFIIEFLFFNYRINFNILCVFWQTTIIIESSQLYCFIEFILNNGNRI